MKVLHVTPSFYPAFVYGGPMVSVYHLCRHLVQKQCLVRVLTTNANGPDSVLSVPTDSEIELPETVRVRYCKRALPDSISPQLLRLLPRYIKWADVVHLMAVYSFPIIPTLFLSKVLKKPVVWSPRGMLQRWDGTTHLRLKQVWDRACRIVAPEKIIVHATSGQEARESRERIPGLAVSIIPNSVEIPESVRHVHAETKRFLYLGRLHPKKGIENLLEAFKMLDGNSGMASTLTIAGAGDALYTERIRSKIETFNLGKNVRMIGSVAEEQKKNLFEQSDVVVVPSYTENFGMVAAEALAHEIPVIVSKGTPWNAVEAKGCGLWVDNDPENIAAAMLKISRMPLREMGKKGREWMRQEFHGSVVAEKMIQLYNQLTVQ